MTDNKVPYPAIGILARLNLHIEQKLRIDTLELPMRTIVNIVTDFIPQKFPFVVRELWRDFYEGSNLDEDREAWLTERMDRHGYAHLEVQAMRLYNLVKQELKIE